MDNFLLIALLGGFGAMIGWGGVDFFAKRAADSIGDAPALFWMQLVGIIPLIFILPFQFSISNLTLANTVLIALLAAGDAVGYLLFFSALEKGKVSIISPVVASYAIFSVIISVIAFDEKITPLILVFFATVFIGILLTSIDLREPQRDIADRKNLAGGIPQAMVAVILFAIFFPFWDDFVSKGDHWVVLVLVLRAFTALFVFLFVRYKNLSLTVEKPEVIRWLIYMGLLDVGAYLALTWGYSQSNHTSIVSMLSAAFSVPTLILARIFLKEKLNVTQWVGVVIIIGSLILMAWF